VLDKGRIILSDRSGGFAMTFLTHFAEQARYNVWANRRLFAMAGAISDELYRRDVGAYFKSLHGTLNHLLTADRIWMRRLTGFGDHPQTLDAIISSNWPILLRLELKKTRRLSNLSTVYRRNG
jgi:uncharacterized damage-inducible protein DinB